MLRRVPDETPLEGSTEEIVKQLHFTVGRAEAGARLDHFLTRRLRGLSRNRVSELIRHHLAGDAKASRRVRAGESYTLRYPTRVKTEPGFPLSVAYEDGDLLIVDKPAGQLVHPTRRSVRNTLIDIVRARFGVEDAYPPTLAHRLDRETSGLLVIARNAVTARRLGAIFHEHRLEKIYHAIVIGEPVPEKGIIDLPIGPDTRSAVAVKQRVDPKAGVPARTRYEVVQSNGRDSLVRLQPETGRLHQIRVHMAAVGHPLVGDKIYGPDENLYLDFIRNGFTDTHRRRLHLERHALHASGLSFRHPVSGRMISVSSPLPQELAEFTER